MLSFIAVVLFGFVGHSQMTIEYDKAAGCGNVYKNNVMLKRLCGWRTNWHTVLGVGCKMLFYDKDAGVIEFYRFDSNGNIHHLKTYNNMRKSWSAIKWEELGNCDGVIRFEQADGYYEGYKCDDNGKLHLQYKK